MTTFVTGVAGFIGSYVAKALAERGESVLGVDNLNNYYDVSLKQGRLARLEKISGFTFQQMDIADYAALEALARATPPKRIVHLAAQAGVRYSLENPAAYVRSNLQGHANILELARHFDVANTVYASSSSVYGGNSKIPFSEDDRTDDQVSFYGATKKSNEAMSHSYSKLYGLSMTSLRFFTVYGPWGRPDMAYWIFADKIMKNEPIRIFNNGNMSRDFTFIDDIVDGVIAAIDKPAAQLDLPVPHRIYNLGNDEPQPLMDLVMHLEKGLGKEAIKQFEPMQKGDVERTWADISRARKELGYTPCVSLADGLQQFVEWYTQYSQQC